MKNFRSSKNLKILEPSNKQQSQLRLKIKSLEEQIQILQKSNLNIFIPLSEHESKPSTNYQAIINKLKTHILTLQQQIQRSKTLIKKVESEREMIRISLQNDIQKLREELGKLSTENEQLKKQNEGLQEQVQEQHQMRKQKEKQVIEYKVENKFIKQDLAAEKKRKETAEKKHEELLSFILAVNFSSRIYKSKQTKITAIETQQLSNLKTYIEELENKIKQILTCKQEKIYHGVRKENLGEEIVRLKQNIDMQLGLQVNNETTKSFLKAYNQTNNKFNQLITSCKLGHN